MAETMQKEKEVAEQSVKEAKRGVEQLKQGEPTQAVSEVSENVPSPLYLYAAGGSILASLVLFLRRNKDASIFVGLWAPTILNMALFYKLLRPSKEV